MVAAAAASDGGKLAVSTEKNAASVQSRNYLCPTTDNANVLFY